MNEAENNGFQPTSDESMNSPESAGADSIKESTPAGGRPSDTEDTHADSSQQQGAPGPGEEIDDMSAFEEQIEDSDLAKALERIAEMEDQLARAQADLYNLNQEYSNFVRRSKEAVPAHREAGQSEVLEALIGVLDDIDAARGHGDLTDGPFAAIAVKLEDTLRSRFALERYGQAGDDFDPQIHEALLANTSSAVDHPVIEQVLQPGYRRAEKIIRATKVVVENPE